MASKFIQSLERVIDKKIPSKKELDEMSKEDLIKFIQQHCTYRELSKSLCKYYLLAFQEIFQEEVDKGYRGPITFETIEGKVIFDKSRKSFKVLPNENLIKLLEKVKKAEDSSMKTVYKNRFYKLLETLYLVESDYKNQKEKGE